MSFSELKQYGAVALIAFASLFSDSLIDKSSLSDERCGFVSKQKSSSVVYDLVEPTETFYDCYQRVQNNQLMGILLKDYSSLLDYLCPETGDVNGEGWFDRNPEPSEYEHRGNEIPDALGELKLIEYVLKNSEFALPNGLTHELVRNAWAHNDRKLSEDVGKNYELFNNTLNGFPQILNGFMIVGDGGAEKMEKGYVDWQGSVGFVQGIMYLLGSEVENRRINPEEYVRLAQFFAPDGDASGNGISNRETFELSGGNLNEFVRNALNPDFLPEGYESSETNQEGSERPLQVERDIYFVNPGETLEIKVVRSGALESSINIPYFFSSENASPERDYLPEKGRLNFNPGERKKVIEFNALKNPENKNSKKCVLRIDASELIEDNEENQDIYSEIFIGALEEKKPFFRCFLPR